MSCSYTAEDHRFRFAAWAAARASSRGVAGFTTEVAQEALAQSGLQAMVAGVSALPETPDRLDAAHGVWCEKVRASATPGACLTYGRAAKLVNVYLKTLFLSDFRTTGKQTVVDAVHPPIDRILLSNLGANEPTHRTFWKKMHRKGWTKFNRDDYTEVIAKVRDVTGGRLWKIESHWEVARKGAESPHSDA